MNCTTFSVQSGLCAISTGRLAMDVSQWTSLEGVLSAELWDRVLWPLPAVALVCTYAFCPGTRRLLRSKALWTSASWNNATSDRLLAFTVMSGWLSKQVGRFSARSGSAVRWWVERGALPVWLVDASKGADSLAAGCFLFCKAAAYGSVDSLRSLEYICNKHCNDGAATAQPVYDRFGKQRVLFANSNGALEPTCACPGHRGACTQQLCRRRLCENRLCENRFCAGFLRRRALVECQPAPTQLARTSNGLCSAALRKEALASAWWNSRVTASAASAGNLGCLHYLHRTGCSWDKSTCSGAALAASIECLNYARENGCAWEEAEVCKAAVRSGCLACLACALESVSRSAGCVLHKSEELDEQWLARLSSCFFINSTCSLARRIARCCSAFGEAARWGNVDCLRCLREYGFAWSGSVCEAAARNGHLNCMRYAHENGCPWGKRTCAVAAGSGRLECLQYAHENGCYWDESTCRRAAAGGHMACLRYAHENGCAWTKKTCCAAASARSLVCLRYAHENGCPWGARTCTKAALSGSIDCLRYAHESGCEWEPITVCFASVRRPSLECFRYVCENSVLSQSIYEDFMCVCEEAARKGHAACLRYAHERGFMWDHLTCQGAVSCGSLKCLRYAHEHGCLWDIYSTCAFAARYGHVDCLRYAHENGCKWGPETCRAAALAGSTVCLGYAHENGCEWDSSTCRAAAFAGSTACLRYAHENHCPWDEKACSVAAAQGFSQCFVYAHKNTLPP